LHLLLKPAPSYNAARLASWVASLLCPGMRLRYVEWGDAPDTLLLLHDVAEAAPIWAPVAERLAERGFRLVAFDLRGTAGS